MPRVGRKAQKRGKNDMNQEINQKWVEALRSGKYRQTRGKLKARNGAMCCLGVLCDIQGAEWEWYQGRYMTEGSSQHLPGRYNPSIASEFTLIGMNDNQKCSFAEIADYIEENL